MMATKQLSLTALWRLLSILSVVAMLLCASACGEEEAEASGESTNLPVANNPTTTLTDVSAATEAPVLPPVLTVSSATAKAGAKNVEVTIAISNNPGILGMDFDLYYDDTAMVLKDAQSAIDTAGSTYTPPARFKNPTTFLWDFQDAGWAADSTILTLSFDILDTATPGDYEIKLMYSYGNIFDGDLTALDVKVTNGNLTVEES